MVIAPTFNVFVTGFGPFPDGNGGHFDTNSSHEVTKLLPKTLSAKSASNPGKAHINIINPTAAEGCYVKTEYKYIRKYIKKLHEDQDGKVDLFLHIGMAFPWEFVSVEQGAFRQDMTSSWTRKWQKNPGYYNVPDDAGHTVKDADPFPWTDVPLGLRPDIDTDAVIEGARAVLRCNSEFLGARTRRHGSGSDTVREPIEIKPHDEAGTYCCGFTFYESMANRFSKGKDVNVLFCHIPGKTDMENLERARDAIVAVIVSAANQMLKDEKKTEEAEQDSRTSTA